MGMTAAKCTNCGANITVDESRDAGICEHCNTAYVTEKLINHYNTYVTKHITKNIYGKEKTEAVEFLERGETFLQLKDWGRAFDSFSAAADVEPGNYKCWLGMIRSATEDFSDLNDTSHIEYYTKALAVADDEQKKTVIAACALYIMNSEKHRQNVSEAKALSEKEKQDEKEMMKAQKLRQKKKLFAVNISMWILFAVFTVVFIVLIITLHVILAAVFFAVGFGFMFAGVFADAKYRAVGEEIALLEKNNATSIKISGDGGNISFTSINEFMDNFFDKK